MFKRIDQSPALARFLEFISTALARQRGLPVVIGILMVIVSFVLQAFNVFVDSRFLELVGVVVLHLGVLAALIGLLVSEALGK